MSENQKKIILLTTLIFLMTGIFFLWFQRLESSLKNRVTQESSKNIKAWGKIKSLIGIFFEDVTQSKEKIEMIKNDLVLDENMLK
ncbi:MAG: hypothetical protein V1851_03220 [Patescibacteria group bacterium]